MRIYIRRFAIALFAVVIVLYTAYQAKNITRGMVLTINAPAQGETVVQSLVTIAGTALHAVDINLNGRSIMVNEAGVFREPLLLAPGYNVVTVYAKDRFGNTVEKMVELIYEPTEDATAKNVGTTTPTLRGV
jgi:hypothetical protein